MKAFGKFALAFLIICGVAAILVCVFSDGFKTINTPGIINPNDDSETISTEPPKASDDVVDTNPSEDDTNDPGQSETPTDTNIPDDTTSGSDDQIDNPDLDEYILSGTYMIKSADGYIDCASLGDGYIALRDFTITAADGSSSTVDKDNNPYSSYYIDNRGIHYMNFGGGLQVYYPTTNSWDENGGSWNYIRFDENLEVEKEEYYWFLSQFMPYGYDGGVTAIVGSLKAGVYEFNDEFDWSCQGVITNPFYIGSNGSVTVTFEDGTTYIAEISYEFKEDGFCYAGFESGYLYQFNADTGEIISGKKLVSLTFTYDYLTGNTSEYRWFLENFTLVE